MFKVVFGGEVPMFHHRIVELRKKKKKTQEAVAKEIGVTRSALSQYELGSRQPDYEIVKNFADYFGTTTDDLLGRDTNSIEETELDKEKSYYASLIANIKDPVIKEQAISYLKFLANSPTDGAKK